jgi:hypothetical protein
VVLPNDPPPSSTPPPPPPPPSTPPTAIPPPPGGADPASAPTTPLATPLATPLEGATPTKAGAPKAAPKGPPGWWRDLVEDRPVLIAVALAVGGSFLALVLGAFDWISVSGADEGGSGWWVSALNWVLPLVSIVLAVLYVLRRSPGLAIAGVAIAGCALFAILDTTFETSQDVEDILGSTDVSTSAAFLLAVVFAAAAVVGWAMLLTRRPSRLRSPIG